MEWVKTKATMDNIVGESSADWKVAQASDAAQERAQEKSLEFVRQTPLPSILLSRMKTIASAHIAEHNFNSQTDLHNLNHPHFSPLRLLTILLCLIARASVDNMSLTLLLINTGNWTQYVVDNLLRWLT